MDQVNKKGKLTEYKINDPQPEKEDEIDLTKG